MGSREEAEATAPFPSRDPLRPAHWTETRRPLRGRASLAPSSVLPPAGQGLDSPLTLGRLAGRPSRTEAQGERARPGELTFCAPEKAWQGHDTLGHMAVPSALACLHICTEKEKRLRGASSGAAQNKPNSRTAVVGRGLETDAEERGAERQQQVGEKGPGRG